ncbi:MAG: dihydrodipicolinate synthase family protein [Acetobacteraceae bacterium]|nr:dihydrodipicolinate synthase family protein [Acetobacteraceae bacterium]
MKSQFISPVVSVFDAKGRLDPEQNHRVYDHLIAAGISGMVILGSTGEFFSLGMQASKDLVDIAVKYTKGRFRVFVGASRMDPEESIELANYAHDKGADGVMIISPYYFRLTDDSVYDYYSTIAAKVAANIFIYNFPDRTGYSVSPAVTLKLASRFKNIVGFKDTTQDMNHTCDLIKTVRQELPYFEIFSGFDNNFAHNILSGGSGCIGGLSNLIPEFFATWSAAVDRGDFAAVAEGQRFVDKMMDLYGIGDPFIPVLKRALVMRGIIDSDACTKPFLGTNEQQVARIRSLLDTMHIARIGAPAGIGREPELMAR